MQYFDWNGTQVTWRNHGETVVVEPWGPDSLRVRAVLMGEVRDDRFALLDPMPSEDVEFIAPSQRENHRKNGRMRLEAPCAPDLRQSEGRGAFAGNRRRKRAGAASPQV